MLKVKQAIFVALPPLLTVLTLTYAYFRHRNVSPSESADGNSSSYIEESFLPSEETPEEVAGKVPSSVVPDPLSADSEVKFPDDDKLAGTPFAVQEKLTLAEAENRLVELASSLSDLPLWQKCLGQSRAVQRFVAALDAFALGKRPLDPLDFLRSSQPFAGEKQGSFWRQNSVSQGRFSPCVELFCAISPAAAAKLYVVLEPAFQEACANLGYRDKSVRDLLTEACSQILSTPVLAEDPLLIAGGKAGLFYWQHPELENLNDAQKLFLRLGSRNAAKVRQQLEAIAAELQLYQ